MKNPPNPEELLAERVQLEKDKLQKKWQAEIKREELLHNFLHKLGVHEWIRHSDQEIEYHKYAISYTCAHKGCMAVKIKVKKHDW